MRGLAYLLLALWGARDFAQYWQRRQVDAGFAPDVSILKPVKGVDQRMYAGFVSHCQQQYAGDVRDCVWREQSGGSGGGGGRAAAGGVSGVCDPAGGVPERLGTAGKVSNLVQMLREARYEHVLINDSDIRVSPQLSDAGDAVLCGREGGDGDGALYRADGDGGARMTVWSRLEALGISTDFMPGVLTARKLEGGIRFGLGSTLATTKTALAKAGGLEALVEYLADDYEMGARIAAAGYRVELCSEVVETTVPAYHFRGFWEHQMRWARSTRDSRKLGYVGLGVTYALPWAMMTVVASGFALWSFSLLSLCCWRGWRWR